MSRSYIKTEHKAAHDALECALREERGDLIVSLFRMSDTDLELLLEAAQLIDKQAQEEQEDRTFIGVSR